MINTSVLGVNIGDGNMSAKSLEFTALFILLSYEKILTSQDYTIVVQVDG